MATQVKDKPQETPEEEQGTDWDALEADFRVALNQAMQKVNQTVEYRIPPKSPYTRLVVAGRTVGYINLSKRSLRIDVPEGNGSYGRHPVTDAKSLNAAVGECAKALVRELQADKEREAAKKQKAEAAKAEKAAAKEAESAKEE